jgi:hypothetical protein
MFDVRCFIAATAIAASTITPLAIPAQAATRLGGVNLAAHCKAVGRWWMGTSFTSSRIYTVGGGAGDWRCSYTGSPSQGTRTSGYGNKDAFDRVCTWQYGQGASAAQDFPWGAYNWYCLR